MRAELKPDAVKLKTKRTNWPRLAIQGAVILVILSLLGRMVIDKSYVADFEAYCPFGGIQALGSYLLNQALSCTMTTSQIVMGVLLFAAVLVFSKLFCAFICPVGTVSEWLGRAGDRFRVRYTITGFADLALRVVKYGLLFVTFYFTLQSNELFCKKFDPYYAAVTGFSSDVVVLYAVIALVIVVAGSVFIRLFWCKYLCPLSALSNIFKFAGFFVAVMTVWLISLRAGAAVSYVWPLAILCAGGFLIEVSGLKSYFLPAVKITRNAGSCIDCGMCAKKCPQAIDVDKTDVVRHVDCNLCSDCVVACPVPNTLQINRRNNLKWLSPIAILLLVAAGIGLGSLWELPTIDQRWVDGETMKKAGIYEQAGLKNIKCFGSSSAFANQMREVDGVWGVATFVKENRIKVYYDPEKLDEVKIQEAIFTPAKNVIHPVSVTDDSVTVVTLKLENFFDPYDFNYLTLLLEQKSSAAGVLTEFGCPPAVKIGFPGNSMPSEEELIQLLESEKLTYGPVGEETTVKLEYEVIGSPEYSVMERGSFNRLFFDAFVMDFNDRKAYSDSVLRIYEIELGENAKLKARFPFLVSHLSADEGVVEFKTLLNSEEREVAQILFVDTLTRKEEIFRALNADSLTITYSDGEVRRMVNPFRFEKEGN